MDLLNRGPRLTYITGDARLPKYSTESFNSLPAHVWPLTAERGDDGAISIGGCRIPDLVQEYGSPLVIVDEADFRARCQAMAEAFGGAQYVHYAAKAFLTAGIAQWVNEEGLSIDVASDGELEIVLRSGFPAERITLHGNNKLVTTLRRAVDAGVGHIVIDSAMEIDRLVKVCQELGKTQTVLVRVTPGVHADTHEFIATSHEDQKFGLSLASGAAYDAARRCAEAPELKLDGLHCHVGSQVFDAEGFALAARRLLGLFATLQEEVEGAANMTVMDLGGGYGIAYLDEESPLDVHSVAADLRGRVNRYAKEKGLNKLDLVVEPGRAIAGPAAVTAYTIGTLKDVPTDDNSHRRYLSVDGGMSDNIRPALYQAKYDGRLANRLAEGEVMPTRVVGSHCESGDILLEDVAFPDDVAPGDLLAVAGTGAYCFSMASRYNQFRRPAVVAVRDGKSRVMIRRETLADLMALDEDANVENFTE